MNLAAFCIRRPVATMLLWLSVITAGIAGWVLLPISALPNFDTPTIQVTATLTGASPETLSTAVATPLEKQFSAIPSLVATSSTSIQGESKITLEFSPTRNIDAAADDVQAALNRAVRSLPPEMTTPPSIRKINPADTPVVLIGLNSPALKLTDLNAYADNLIIPALSTLSGVAQVTASGRKRYAVRVEIDPDRLTALGLTLIDISTALRTANAHSPVGQLDGKRQMLMLQTTDGLVKAADFARIIIATRNGRPVRLENVAQVLDSIENLQDTSSINGESSITLNVQRQPGANTVALVDQVKAMMPRLRGQMPNSVNVKILNDRSVSIRSAVHDVMVTMALTMALVIMVILLFLRRMAATIIPSISLPISLLGTFALMYAYSLSLNNISLMGLTIAVGLVVDDAIVVLENIMRHMEAGMKPLDAAIHGTGEVSFTVMSISVSLVAVFIPIFFMPGTTGLLFHEFAIVVTLAILVSAAVALTLIPVMVPMWLKLPQTEHVPSGWMGHFESVFAWLLKAYERRLDWALQHRNILLLVALSTIMLGVWLYIDASKGYFPREDIGQISANVDTPQDMSYEGRLEILKKLEATLMKDPYIEDLTSKVDHDTTAFTITLKNRSQRPGLDEVLSHLRKETTYLPNIKVFFSPVQNLRVGGRGSKSTYQYTLQSVSPGPLDYWAETLLAELRNSSVLTGLNSDSQKNGMQALVTVDRDKAAILGVDMASIQSTLYGAFGSRQVSTIYAPEDSYQVIMELSDQHRRDENDIARLYVRNAAGSLVPLSALATIARTKGRMAVNHQGQLPAVTISFDLSPGSPMSEATKAINAAQTKIGMPPSIFGTYAGQAALFQQSQDTQIWLILIAVAVIYVVLGMLYESWIHPVTILLGIPSAGVGALLALRIASLELTFIAMIGILLLIGIVKKNAIMMIDFALAAERSQGLGPEQAIRQACITRFRPIMMTTFCAVMGALPLALGLGAGSELRQPLGVTIVGGLLFSQLITLFITPVIYVWFENIRQRCIAPRTALRPINSR